jgi:hypothetical protein
LGRYDFHVAAFDNDHAIHGWTATAGVTSAVDPPPALPPHPVTGAFRVRWYELGGAAGPLGDPAGPFRRLVVPGSSAAVQDFAHGQMVSHAAQGFDFVLSAHQVGASIEVLWGGSDAPYDVFAVDVEKNSERYQTLNFDRTTAPTWARPGRGSGRVRLDLFGTDTHHQLPGGYDGGQPGCPRARSGRRPARPPRRGGRRQGGRGAPRPAGRG